MPVQTTSAPTQAYTKVKAGIPVLDSAKKVIDDSKLYLPNSRTINEVLFTADDFSKLFSPDTSHYQGLLVLRPQNPLRYQAVADSLPDGALGKSQPVDLRIADASPCNLNMRLASAASMLCSNINLPQELSSLVCTDAVNIGQALARLLPQEASLVMKLENVGQDNCPRWHQDYYVARAIVSYNGKGTEYTNDGNVDFWELENCGNNDCIIRDTSMIRCVGCGDILLMKGLRYPSAENGLVHKSPKLEYHSTGNVKKRFVLKIDVGHRQ